MSNFVKSFLTRLSDPLTLMASDQNHIIHTGLSVHEIQIQISTTNTKVQNRQVNLKSIIQLKQLCFYQTPVISIAP